METRALVESKHQSLTKERHPDWSGPFHRLSAALH
jgi:hypothetical protein